MLLKVARLLLILPLLLPQGVCVCMFMAPASEAPVQNTASPMRSSRCACNHRHVAATTSSSCSLPGFASAADAPNDDDDQHLPACPGRKLEWKALSGNALVNVTAPALWVPLCEVLATDSSTPFDPFQADFPSAPPLYLSLLNLRI